MRIFVKAKPNAREEKVEKIDKTHFAVSVKEPPVRKQANVAIIAALAKHFNVCSDSVRIITGYTSKNKIVEVAENT